MPRSAVHTSAALAASLLAASALLSGCALITTASPVAQPGAALHGTVHGGQPPVIGAHIYLFAAGASGYGGASSSLLTPVPLVTATDGIGTYVTTTAPGGSFSLTGDYTCTPGQQLYLLATGGNPGLGGSATNPALSLLAAIGACPANGAAGLADRFVGINEVTTVAAAYALSGFFTDPTHLSSGPSTQSALGLANAFLNVPNLVDPAAGVALAAIPGNGSAPQARVNTLADILGACVNSDGTGDPCATLFANAPNGATIPTDTATAAINIAHNQTANAANLFNLLPATPAFAPLLATAPADFTLPVTFAPPNLAATHLAVNASGNVFFVGGSNFVTELSSNGLPVSGSPFSPDDSITAYSGLTLESTGDLWLAISGSSAGPAVARFAPDLTLIARYNNVKNNGISTGLPGNIFTSSTIQDQVLGIDIPASGPGIQFITLLSNGLSSPGAVATSSTGIQAILNAGSSLSSFLQDGTSNGNVSVGLTPAAIAIDASDIAWSADTGDSTLTATQLAVGSLTTASYPTAIASPTTIAIDGNPAGTGLWYSNAAGLIGNSLAGAPTTSFSSGLSPAPLAIAPDLSGNLWTANGSSATQFIGLSVPVATPVLPAQLGIRP